MSEDTKNLKKKTNINWRQIQKTALNFGLQLGLSFASGMALAAGQNVANRLVAVKNELTDGQVIQLRSQKVV